LYISPSLFPVRSKGFWFRDPSVENVGAENAGIPVPAPPLLANIAAHAAPVSREAISEKSSGTLEKMIVASGNVVLDLEPECLRSGLVVPGALADPTLELHAANDLLIMPNDDWQKSPAQAAELTNLGLAPPHPKESGLVATLDPGAYTAILAGKNESSGIAVVEVYDATNPLSSQLKNISSRGFVRAGDNVMIGGFILRTDTGNAVNNTKIVVRGIGPSLAQFGLSPALSWPIPLSSCAVAMAV
jgi:hypothetical protein